MNPLSLRQEIAYGLAGIAGFIVVCIAFYLVWQFQHEVLLPFLSGLF